MLCHPFQRTYFYYSVLSLSSFVICLSPPLFFFVSRLQHMDLLLD